MSDIKFKLVLLSIAWVVSFMVLAQAPASQQKISEYKGLEIENYFEKGEFDLAAFLISDLHPSDGFEREQQDYFEAKLALKIDNSALLAKAFYENRRSSRFDKPLAVDLANYYFDKGKVQDAIFWYHRGGQLNPSDTYKLGLAYFQSGQQDSATNCFRAVPITHELNGSAQYNMGIIEWKKDRKDWAVRYFKEAAKSSRTSVSANAYLARYSFDQKDYGKAKALSNAIIESFVGFDRFDLLLIRGLSFYYLEEFPLAANDLREAWDINRTGMSAESLYALALSYSRSNQGELAAVPLREVVKKGGDYGQDAAYKLGLWYVSQENYNEAIALWQLARQGSNESLVRQAHYLQIKSLLKIERYNEAIPQLENYRETYPQINKVESSELLTSAYYHTSDYDKTLEFIESSKTLTPATRKIYQEVAYRKGLLLFNDQQMEQAIDYFDKSLQNQLNEELTILAKLYSAEAHSYLLNYQASIPYYLQVIRRKSKHGNVYQQALYGLAYAYYNDKQYQLALNYFSQFAKLKSSDLEIKLESVARISDCLFVTKQYEKAALSYKKLLNTYWSAYAHYQLGKVYDLMDQPETALIYLRSFEQGDTVSAYRESGLLLLGHIRTDLQKYREAIAAFDQIIVSDDSPFLAESLLGKGLAATNAEVFAEAEKSYQRLIDHFPDSEYADDALLGLQTLAEKGYELTDFDQYLKIVADLQPDNTSLNRIAFERAKSDYFQQDYDQAVRSLKNFIANNPQSSFVQEAYYYLGDSYFRQFRWEASIQSFEGYLEKGTGSFYTRVLDRQGRAALEISDLGKARESFDELLKYARSDRDIYQGKMGLLQVLEREGRFDEVLVLADKMLMATWKPVSADEELAMIKSHAYQKLDNNEKAVDELIKVINSRESEVNVAAQFQLALIQADEGKRAVSNETLLQLIGNYGSYHDWKNKAYIQLIANYRAQQNELQARATIMSILENSQDSLLVAEVADILQQMDFSKEITNDSTEATQNE